MKTLIYTLLLLVTVVSCNHDTESRQPWPDGQIPFIVVGFTPEEEFEIVKAMITWELASGGKISFFIYGTRESKTKPLIIQRGSNVSFAVGTGYSKNGYNFIQLNIKDILILAQFATFETDFLNYKKYPFDYESIMMYSDSDWGDVIDGHGHKLGGDTLTCVDAWKVSDIYSETLLFSPRK